MLHDEGLFSDSESEPDPEQEIEEAPQRAQTHRNDQGILVTPALPVQPGRRAPRPTTGPRIWNEATRHVPDDQRRWKATVMDTLLRSTHLSDNMIREILGLVPPQYTGTQRLPEASASVFKVHIHSETIGVVLTRDGLLYVMHLKTGQFLRGKHTHYVARMNRVKSAAFHPTKPILFAQSHSSSQLTVIWYPVHLGPEGFVPTTLVPSPCSVTKMDPGVGHVLTNGISVVEHGFALSTSTSFQIHTIPPELYEGTFSTAAGWNETLAGQFFKLSDVQLSPTLSSRFFWQRRGSTLSPAPLLRSTLSNESRHDVHHYGPTSKILDALECKTNDRVVAMTSKHAIFVWDQEGRHLKTIRKHHGLLQSMAIHQTTLISASFDKSVRFWDLESLEQKKKGNASSRWHTGKKKPQAAAVCGEKVLIGYDTKEIEVFELE